MEVQRAARGKGGRKSIPCKGVGSGRLASNLQPGPSDPQPMDRIPFPPTVRGFRPGYQSLESMIMMLSMILGLSGWAQPGPTSPDALGGSDGIHRWGEPLRGGALGVRRPWAQHEVGVKATKIHQSSEPPQGTVSSQSCDLSPPSPPNPCLNLPVASQEAE